MGIADHLFSDCDDDDARDSPVTKARRPFAVGCGGPALRQDESKEDIAAVLPMPKSARTIIQESEAAVVRKSTSAAGLSGCIVFLCPLGAMSATRRRLLECRVRDCGGKCSGTVSGATHCVVDATLPFKRFCREAYIMPSSCDVVTDTWLMQSLQVGRRLPETEFRFAFAIGMEDQAPRVHGPLPTAEPRGAEAALRHEPFSQPTAPSVAAKELTMPLPASGEVEEVPQAALELHGAVGLDCEFVGVGRNTAGIGGDRNALARVSVVLEGGRVLLDTTVRVDEPVVDFRIHVTGLTQATLDAGISRAEARAWVMHFVYGRIVVGHSLSHDWKVLDYTHPPELVRDTARFPPLRLPHAPRKVPSLGDLTEAWLGRTIQDGVHDSVEDAAAALELYMQRRSEWDATVGDPSLRQMSMSAAAAVPPPPPWSGEAPCGAATLVAGVKAATASSALGPGFNLRLAADFERRAARPGAPRHASLHYRRVARTLSHLPFAVDCEGDLDRPELACLGKPGCHTRRVATALIHTLVPRPFLGSCAGGGTCTDLEEASGNAKGHDSSHGSSP